MAWINGDVYASLTACPSLRSPGSSASSVPSPVNQTQLLAEPVSYPRGGGGGGYSLQNLNLLFPIFSENPNHSNLTDRSQRICLNLTEQGLGSNISRTWYAILNAWFSRLFEIPKRERALHPPVFCLGLSASLHRWEENKERFSEPQSTHQRRTSRMFR